MVRHLHKQDSNNKKALLLTLQKQGFFVD